MKNLLISEEQFNNNDFAIVEMTDDFGSFETNVAFKPMEQLDIVEGDKYDDCISYYFENWTDWCDIIENGLDEMVITKVIKMW